MKAQQVRAASVAIASGRTIYAKRAYTWAEPGNVVTTTTTTFRLASVSKLFTAAAVQRLGDDGVIDLGASVFGYLGLFDPGPHDARKDGITIAQCATSLSGMPHDYDPAGTKLRDLSIGLGHHASVAEQAAHMYFAVPLAFPRACRRRGLGGTRATRTRRSTCSRPSSRRRPGCATSTTSPSPSPAPWVCGTSRARGRRATPGCPERWTGTTAPGPCCPRSSTFRRRPPRSTSTVATSSSNPEPRAAGCSPARPASPASSTGTTSTGSVGGRAGPGPATAPSWAPVRVRPRPRRRPAGGTSRGRRTARSPTRSRTS